MENEPERAEAFEGVPVDLKRCRQDQEEAKRAKWERWAKIIAVAASVGYAALTFLTLFVYFRGETLYFSVKQTSEAQSISTSVALTEEETVAVDLTGSSFRRVLEEQTYTFVTFYAPWCHWSQEFLPDWQDVARCFEMDSDILIAQYDCIASPDICHEEGVKKFPTLQFYKNGKPASPYMLADRSVSTLVDYVNYQRTLGSDLGISMERETEDETVAVQLAPTSSCGFHCLTEEQKYTYVVFHVPWCALCQDLLSSVWQDVARYFVSNVDILVAQLDCAASPDACNGEGITTFPTWRFYTDGTRYDEWNEENPVDKDFLIVMGEAMMNKDRMHINMTADAGRIQSDAST